MHLHLFNFLYRVRDLHPRWATRRQAGFSCAILYFMAWKSRTSVVLPFVNQAYVGDFTEFRKKSHHAFSQVILKSEVYSVSVALNGRDYRLPPQCFRHRRQNTLTAMHTLRPCYIQIHFRIVITKATENNIWPYGCPSVCLCGTRLLPLGRFS